MKASEVLFCVVDTETTGLDHETDRIVEVAAIRFSYENGPDFTTFATLVDPEREIPPQASAVHQLVSNDVADAPNIHVASHALLAYIGDAVPVAHNAEFDAGFLPAIARPWLCTKRLAQHLWQDAPEYKNQTLRFWLPGGAAVARGEGSHRALADCKVTAFLLDRLIRSYLAKGYPDDVDELLKLAASPILLQKIRFGKYVGTPFSELPVSYLTWMTKQDFDSDILFTVKHEIHRRGVAA